MGFNHFIKQEISNSIPKVDRDYVDMYFTSFDAKEPKRPAPLPEPEPPKKPAKPEEPNWIVILAGGILLFIGILSFGEDDLSLGCTFFILGILFCPVYYLSYQNKIKKWSERCTRGTGQWSTDIETWKQACQENNHWWRQKRNKWLKEKTWWEKMDPRIVDDALRADVASIIPQTYSDLSLIVPEDSRRRAIGPNQVVRDPVECYGPTERAFTGEQNTSNKLNRRKGTDGKWRFREYEILVVHFTKDQLCIFKCRFDIARGTMHQIELDELNYNHVVGFNVKLELVRDTQSGNEYGQSQTLEIATSGGDKITIMIGELFEDEPLSGNFEVVATGAIKTIRSMIRDKAAR